MKLIRPTSVGRRSGEEECSVNRTLEGDQGCDITPEGRNRDQIGIDPFSRPCVPVGGEADMEGAIGATKIRGLLEINELRQTIVHNRLNDLLQAVGISGHEGSFLKKEPGA